MLSLGMLAAFAVVTAVRRRGLALTSPPPIRAATVISLIILVKILPRLASLAAFLCLIELHFEWPDMSSLSPSGSGSSDGARCLDLQGRLPRAGSAARDWMGIPFVT